MKRSSLIWAVVVMSLILVEGCGGSGRYRVSGPHVGVGFGFYHHGYGGWGSGYYRGYDHGAVDAVDTIDTIDAMDSMGMPDMDMDMDMGPAMDFDF